MTFVNGDYMRLDRALVYGIKISFSSVGTYVIGSSLGVMHSRVITLYKVTRVVYLMENYGKDQGILLSVLGRGFGRLVNILGIKFMILGFTRIVL